MGIKLLALDLDGTLLGPTYKIAEKDYEAVEQVKALGIIVILLTGRRFRIALPYAQELGLNFPLVVHNGALIKDPSTGDVISCVPLSLTKCKRVIRIARENQLDPVVTINRTGFGKLLIDSLDQKNARLVKYLWFSEEDVLKVDDLLHFLKEDPIQVTFSDKPSKVDQLNGVLKRSLNGHIRMLETRYLNRDLSILDIVNPKVSKGTALSFIASRYQIKPDQILALGDNFNDLDMLKFAGTGVIMGNADEKLKTMGFPVTLSNEQGGVAEAIKRYILD